MGIRELVAALLGCFFWVKPKEEKEALFTPTFWAQKVGKNACPPEGESRLRRDRGRPWALHALFACGKRNSAPGAAFRCHAGAPANKHRTTKENYSPALCRSYFFPFKRTGLSCAKGQIKAFA